MCVKNGRKRKCEERESEFGRVFGERVGVKKGKGVGSDREKDGS